MAALSCIVSWAPAHAQQSDTKVDVATPVGSKEEAHARMRYLADEIERLRAADVAERYIAPLAAHLAELSASLGGDLPARRGTTHGASGLAPVSSSGAQALSAPACGNAALTTVNFPGTTGVIVPAAPLPTTFTATVAGAGTFAWDVNLTTFFTHTDCSDLDVTLTSPAGTTIVITTDNGGTNDNVFNGTVWDDNGVGFPRAVGDVTYANLVTATPLHPEGRLTAFRGEDPNGVWTLTVEDDVNIDTGALNAWSIDVTTVAGAPVETTTNFTRSPALVISTSGMPTVTDSVLVSGLAPSISKLTFYIEVPHTFVGDLEILLTAPSGTQVRVASDCGIGEDNVFNGTLFDPASTLAPTDFPYVDLVTVPLLAPEGAFDTLLGQDPNGTWTLTVFDDAGADGGTVVRWDLNISTAVLPVPSAPTNAAGTTGAIPDHPAPPAAPTTFTTLVSGMGTYLWDVDLTTFIAHTSAADIDMTLTSPSGTVVEITTDSGGTNDNVFNGTLWDDNSNDTTADHTYTNNVVAALLTPEGRLGAFRGEDPNGVWTLTITDDATAADYGSLNAWSLDVTSLATAPLELASTFSQSPGILISTAGTSSSLDTIAVSGLEVFVKEIEVFVQVAHTDCGDLDIFLTSPNGTVVKLTTDNSGTNDNCFNGTLFDASSTDTITNHVYANNVVVPLIAPEGAFDNFIGENPNGNWTLDVQDDLNTDGGTFLRWDLTIKTCVGAGDAFCTNGSLGVDHTTGCPCGNTGLPGNGCGHSFDGNGANLSASGSSAADTVVLHSQFEPASSFTLMMQHANAGDTVFFDGVLCAANPLIRLRGRAAVGGEAFFPNSNFAQDSTTTLSIRGGTFPGSGATMRYAAWYRNASTTFCPPATANVTNGWVITW